MNNARRKQIAELVEQIDNLKTSLEDIQNDEECYRDEMPENLQGSERFENSEEASDMMEAAMDSLGEAADNLTDIN